MTTFPAPTVLLLVICALIVGACFGWLTRGARPPREFAPHRVREAADLTALKTSVKPAAPPTPLWERDAFFPHPDDLGGDRDIERSSYVSYPPIARGHYKA